MQTRPRARPHTSWLRDARPPWRPQTGGLRTAEKDPAGSGEVMDGSAARRFNVLWMSRRRRIIDAVNFQTGSTRSGGTTMTVVSKRVFRPIPGKTALAHSRIKRLSEVLTRVGGRVRVCTVAWGDGARDVHLYGSFQNMEAGAKAFAAMIEDPEGVKLRTESENDPASEWEGPEVWRTVFGEPQPNYPVMLQREYRIDRRTSRAPLRCFRKFRPLLLIALLLASCRWCRTTWAPAGWLLREFTRRPRRAN